MQTVVMAPIHIGIYISAGENVDRLINDILHGKRFDFTKSLQGQQAELFSTPAVKQFVREELLHNHFELKVDNGHSLATSSSGEQRRALLEHIIAKKPGFIVVDNLFESLDHRAQEEVVALLAGISAYTSIIQLLYRKHDCLPFISQVICVENGRQTAVMSRSDFLEISLPSNFLQGSLPGHLTDENAGDEMLVEMKHVRVSYNGRPVLDGIDWELRAGEFWQLKGPNGSGKTTLLSMIVGDNVKGYGQELFLFGKKKGSGESVWDIKAKIGYFNGAVAGDYPRQDSAENMILSGFMDSVGLYLVPSELQKEIAEHWLQLLNLWSQRDTPFRMLTLAQQRMVLIARAMVKHPPLLILDEPTTGLDDAGTSLFISLINKIASERTVTIVYVSHREEPGLSAIKFFELIPGANGSTGRVTVAAIPA